MEAKHKILGIIPARYGSTRFPGKPLVMIQGKTMIQRVYEAALDARIEVIVATDHIDIHNHIISAGGNSVMTSTCETGTDRCAEVSKMYPDYDYIVNIQGDQPFVQPDQIRHLIELTYYHPQIATLVTSLYSNDAQNNNVVKAICTNPKKDKNVFECFYFTRSEKPEPSALKHIGIYAYRSDVLQKISKLPISSLEKFLNLEQMRWLENGYRIMASYSMYDSISVDTPDDLKKFD